MLAIVPITLRIQMNCVYLLSTVQVCPAVQFEHYYWTKQEHGRPRRCVRRALGRSQTIRFRAHPSATINLSEKKNYYFFFLRAQCIISDPPCSIDPIGPPATKQKATSVRGVLQVSRRQHFPKYTGIVIRVNIKTKQ